MMIFLHCWWHGDLVCECLLLHCSCEWLMQSITFRLSFNFDLPRDLIFCSGLDGLQLLGVLLLAWTVVGGVGRLHVCLVLSAFFLAPSPWSGTACSSRFLLELVEVWVLLHLPLVVLQDGVLAVAFPSIWFDGDLLDACPVMSVASPCGWLAVMVCLLQPSAGHFLRVPSWWGCPQVLLHAPSSSRWRAGPWPSACGFSPRCRAVLLLLIFKSFLVFP